MKETIGNPSILHVTQPTDGGVATYVAMLVSDQVGRGFEVAVASPGEGLLARETVRSGAAHHRWVAGREPGPDLIGDVRRLRRVIAGASPDLVHLHSSKAGLAGRLALRGRLPTVFQPHAWSFEAVERLMRRGAILWERAASRWAHVVLCVSEGERARGEEHGIRANWRVIPNGVDLEALPEASSADRAAARGRLGLDGAPLAVCVGRLSRQKGQDVLLEAWPAVTAQVPEAQLALVGGGPDERKLRALADGLVRFAGQRDDVADWLAAADVVVAPSRWEGMSLSMLEAMARGRSVVATDVTGAREALGEDGALVPPENPPALARAVADRLLNPEQAAGEGQEARRRAERSHDLRRTTEAIAQLYGELLV